MNYQRNVFHKAADAMLLRQSILTTWAREHIIKSQKFIIPDAGKMTEGKAFDNFKEVMKLPFPRVSLLREVEVDGVITQQICMAADSFSMNRSANDHIAFYVADALRVPGTDLWGPSRPIGVEILERSGILLYEIEGAKEEEERLLGGAHLPDINDREGFGALNGLTELMLMLSLHNVSTKTISPSRKLNLKRQRAGKLPLYDYHVLLVDGAEVCDSERCGSPSDRQIRSHYRRGHIRRLDETRRIWVRATFVHGSAKGFVDKDYRVSTGSAVASAL